VRKEKEVALCGKGKEIDEIQKRLEKGGYKVLRFSQTPYCDAEIMLRFRGHEYLNDSVYRLIARLVPKGGKR
jgi:hypothetical protein